MKPKPVRITEAAKILGVHPNTLRRMCDKEQIRYRTISDLYATKERNRNMNKKKEIKTKDPLSGFMKAWADIAGVDLTKGFAISMMPGTLGGGGMTPVGTIMVCDVMTAGPPCEGFTTSTWTE